MTLRVGALQGLATIQDGGRPGRMHDGVPPGGALVPELLACANAAAGNRSDAAAIELFGAMTIEAEAALTVATDDGAPIALDAGEALVVPPSSRARARYVAVRGGFDVPVVLGGRGTLLVARLGGLEGRPLRRGDRLAIANDVVAPPRAVTPPAFDHDRAIGVVLGPDRDAFTDDARATLLSATYRITPASDRTGIRLEGPPLARRTTDALPSAPMVAGAIEVPASGAPIVLGPDHPTTGGYPLVAVVVTRDRGALGARRVGGLVRFVAVDR